MSMNELNFKNSTSVFFLLQITCLILLFLATNRMNTLTSASGELRSIQTFSYMVWRGLVPATAAAEELEAEGGSVVGNGGGGGEERSSLPGGLAELRPALLKTPLFGYMYMYKCRVGQLCNIM